MSPWLGGAILSEVREVKSLDVPLSGNLSACRESKDSGGTHQSHTSRTRGIVQFHRIVIEKDKMYRKFLQETSMFYNGSSLREQTQVAFLPLLPCV